MLLRSPKLLVPAALTAAALSSLALAQPAAAQPTTTAAVAPATVQGAAARAAATKVAVTQAKAAAAATTHLYVATTGSDSNPGTQAKPYRSLQKAANVVRPGTVVHVAPGTYSHVESRVDGTASARIVFQSDVKWGAKVVSTDDWEPWWNYGNYVDIVGFSATAPNARIGIASEASYTRVMNNHVYSVALNYPCTSSGGAGIHQASYDGTNNEVSGNWVHDIGPKAGCNLIHGIYLAQKNGIIRNNIVANVSGWCLHTWHAATNVTITHNLAFKCGVAAANSGGGIVVGAGDKPEGVYAANFVVANNIVVDSYRGLMEGGRIGANNRFVNNDLFRVAKPVTLVKGTQSGTRYVDPQFVNYQTDGRGDYHLRATSPLIDVAAALGVPAADYAGVARPQGKGPDIGPLEYRAG